MPLSNVITRLTAIFVIAIIIRTPSLSQEPAECTGRPYTMAAAWSTNGDYFAVNRGRAIYVYNKDFTLLSCIMSTDSESLVYAMAWQPAGNLLAVAGVNADVHGVFVWDITKKEIVASLTVPSRDYITSIVWNEKGSLLASGTFLGEIYIWNVPSGTLVKKYQLDSGRYINSLAWNPKKNLLAVAASDNGKTTLLDIDTGKTVATIKIGEEPLAVVWSPDGKRLAIGSSSDDFYALETMYRWPVHIFTENGRMVAIYRIEPNTSILSLVWLNDNRQLAGNGLNGKTTVGDTNKNKVLHVF
jgi:WD40 repeat protein